MTAVTKALRSKIFISFLVSYVLMLLIPLAVSLSTYRQSLSIVEQDAKTSSLTSLRQAVIALDSRFAEVESIAMQLGTSPQLLSFTYANNPYVDRTTPVRIFELQTSLAPVTLTNNFIDIVGVYFSKSDVFITNRHSHLKMDDFYVDFLQYGDLTPEQWETDILIPKHHKTYFPVAMVERDKLTSTSRNIRPMLLFVQSFPLQSLDKGQILILIDNDKLEPLMQDAGFSQGGWACILDKNGQMLTSFGTDDFSIDVSQLDLSDATGVTVTDASGTAMIVTWLVSQRNGWKYISVLPYHVVMNKVDAIKLTSTIIMVLAVLIGLCGAFAMAYMNSKPIRALIDVTRRAIGSEPDESGKQNEYAFLRSSILDLVSSNHTLEENYVKQLPLLKATFVSRLLSGDFADENDALVFIDQLGFARLSGKMAVIIAKSCQIDPHQDNILVKEINAIRVILNDALSTYLGDTYYYHDLDFEKRAIVIQLPAAVDTGPTQHSDRNYIESILISVWETINRSYGICFQFYIGSLADGIMSVSRSFDEAIETLNYQKFSFSRKTIWHEDLPKDDKAYYYPVATESRLVNLTQTGNWTEAERILNRIHQENFIKRDLTPAMIHYLLDEIIGTLLKLVDLLSIDQREIMQPYADVIRNLDRNQSCTDQFNQMYDQFRKICQIVSDIKRGSHSIIDEMNRYLEEHYMDQQMSLAVMADHFQYAPAYLSQLFKEKNNGMNFSARLEEIRMRHACQLIRQGMNIQDVARQVGYNSVSVFRKAFQRTVGSMPSEYRCNQDTPQ